MNKSTGPERIFVDVGEPESEQVARHREQLMVHISQNPSQTSPVTNVRKTFRGARLASAGAIATGLAAAMVLTNFVGSDVIPGGPSGSDARVGAITLKAVTLRAGTAVTYTVSVRGSADMSFQGTTTTDPNVVSFAEGEGPDGAESVDLRTISLGHLPNGLTVPANPVAVGDSWALAPIADMPGFDRGTRPQCNATLTDIARTTRTVRSECQIPEGAAYPGGSASDAGRAADSASFNCTPQPYISDAEWISTTDGTLVSYAMSTGVVPVRCVDDQGNLVHSDDGTFDTTVTITVN